jgi:hypothetical protein
MREAPAAARSAVRFIARKSQRIDMRILIGSRSRRRVKTALNLKTAAVVTDRTAVAQDPPLHRWWRLLYNERMRQGG